MTDSGFPPVPSQVFSVLGPLQVIQGDLAGDLGQVQFPPRIVTLAPDQSPPQAWQTYWHEAVHVALWDAGVKLTHKVEENICDVIGTYLAAAVLAGFIVVPSKP